jgi:hypothetical protein
MWCQQSSESEDLSSSVSNIVRSTEASSSSFSYLGGVLVCEESMTDS